MKCTIESPLGPVSMAADGEFLVHVLLNTTETPQQTLPSDKVLVAAIEQLNAYFKGQLTMFHLPLAPRGTAFQQAVWAALQEIPYGETCAYQDIAQSVGRPNAARAVGAANALNPWWIVVPCHRVIGANGKLTGYAGGLPAKQWLLQHETWQRARCS